jgi:hypothetical protein
MYLNLISFLLITRDEAGGRPAGRDQNLGGARERGEGEQVQISKPPPQPEMK